MLPPIDLGHTLAHALDAALWAAEALGIVPDPWQRQLLCSASASRQIILNCCRQAGKSTATALLALHTAIFEPESLILLCSPSQRQSCELFAKVMFSLKRLDPAVPLEEDNRLSAELRNGSRIVSLPGDARTIRGYSAPRLVIADEAGYCPDDLFTAIRPMLAVSEGKLCLLSTPAGRGNEFYRVWTSPGDDWEKIKIIGEQCPRISRAFLDRERAALGPLLFSQEFEGAFIDADTSVFSAELIAACLDRSFGPFPS